MRRWFLIPIGLAVAFAALQPFAGHISNPAGRAEPQWDEHVAPISWWIQGHVSDGRRRLNFDAWDPSHHRSGADIARTVTEGSMPPSYYTWFGLHAAANLTAAQRAELAAGLQKTIGPAVGVSERFRRSGGD